MGPIRPNPSVTFKVRYEDEHLLVVDKPSGRVTQPGLGHDDDSLLNGLWTEHGERLRNLGQARDFGLLHRLDRAASGLLVVGLTRAAYDELRRMFEAREVKKFYWAIVRGGPERAKGDRSTRAESGIIRKPLLEFERGGRKLARPSRDGKPAITAYRVLERGGRFSLLECRTLTGRLHQVRVHLDSIGCPIIGDKDYASPGVAAAAPRLVLHAHRLAFAHPISRASVDVRSPWPRDLRDTLRRCGLERPDIASADRADEVARDGVGDEKPAVGEPPAID